MSEEVLDRITKRFIESTGYIPVIALEAEFYLATEDPAIGDQLLALLYVAAKKEGIEISKIDRETGAGQYEIALMHNKEVVQQATNLIRLKDIVRDTAIQLGTEALFSAKPFPQQPGSGLHVHLSLHDTKGHNLFKKTEPEKETELMMQSVGGLCDAMVESFLLFAPYRDSFKRFTADRNPDAPEDEPLREHNHAPVNISWGGNNRTVAIRIPASTHSPENRHIEHRVAGADANPYLVTAAVLAGVWRGIEGKKLPATEKMYGNAFDDQYKRPDFPKTLEDARTFYEQGKISSLLQQNAN